MVLPLSRPFLCLWDRCLLMSTSQWMGICTLAFLTPQINIVHNQTLTVPLAAHSQSRRAIQFIPLLFGLGIMAGIGTVIWGIASSTTFYHTLSKDFTDDIEKVVKSLVALQDQLDSLAEVVLQNRRGLDTALFLPGESQGQRSLVGCCLWGHTESDTTEAT